MSASLFLAGLLLAVLPPLSAALIVPVPASCSSAPGNCVAALLAAVASCAAAPSCTIALEAGTYVLTGPRGAQLVVIAGARNVLLTGAGPNATTLMVSDLANAFILDGVSNFTIAELTMDMVRPPFTLGHVTASRGRLSTLSFDSSKYPIDLARYPWLGQGQAIIGFDVVANRMARAPAVDDYFLEKPCVLTFLDASTFTINASLTPGTDVIVRHQVYAYNGFSAYNSDAVAFSNVTLLAAGGMGLFTSNCSGVALDGFRVMRAPGRVMSITADGVHFSNSRHGAVTVRRCVFEGQGDDGMNIPTLYTDIESISADRLTLTVGKDGVPGPNWDIFAVGATINFFSRPTFRPLGSGVVAQLAPPATVVLAAPLPAAVSLYDSINSAEGYADYVEVTDSLFKDNRARGALLKSSNVYCARNVFDHCTGPAIKTESDICFWFEGHPVRNWTVTKNRFVGCNYATAACLGDVSVDNSVPIFVAGQPTATCEIYSASPVHYNLTITDNTFEQDAGQSALYAYAVEGIVVAGNTVLRNTSTPTPSAGDLVGVGCVDGATSGNTCNGGACKISGL